MSTRTVTGTIPVANPWSVAMDSAAHRLYVSSVGDSTITVIDTATGKPTATVVVGAAPLRLALDGSTHGLCAINRREGTVMVIDTTTTQ